MTTATLTSRDRVNRAVERRDHDRVPRQDGIWDETLAKWQTQGFEGDRDAFLKWLGADFQGISWSRPSPYPHRFEVIREDDETQWFIDRNGNTHRGWKHRTGTPEHVAFGCTSFDQWENVYKPALLSHGPQFDRDVTARIYREAHAQDKWLWVGGPDPFESMRQLLGDEVVLMAMASEPDWAADMAQTYADLYLRDYQAVIDMGMKLDGVWMFGDIAYVRGPFFSPAMYRQLIWPQQVRICQWAHERGMKYIYHTDGDVRRMIPLFIEGGFDCLQPLEAKAHMDVRELVPRYGDDLSFFGNIDMMVASTNDRGLIEHEVVSKLRAGMSKRGYLYYSDHSVPPQVDWATYQFIIELVDREGVY